jgi:general stress protein YciG
MTAPVLHAGVLSQEMIMATNDKGNKQSDNTSKRGFASMDPEQQREIAAEGGRAAHEKGTAHEFTSEEARKAGAMSHKNDPGRSKQSANPGNKGSAKPEEEEDEGENMEQDNSKGGRGGSRSK